MITMTNSLVARPTASDSKEIVVYVRINLRSATQDFKLIEISTRLKCEKNKWDQKAGQFKGSNPRVQANNNRLNQLRADVMTAFNSCNSSGNFDLEKFKLIVGCKGAKAVKQRSVLDLFTEYQKKHSSELSDKRKGRYDLTQERFTTFLASQYQGQKLKPQDISRDHFLYFKNDLQQQGLSHNTVTNYLKIIKAVFREAANSKIIKEFPFNDCSTVHTKSNRTYLTSDELSRIENLPGHLLTARQKLVRDLFVFACYTGVGFSDLATLQTDHLVTSLQGTMLVKTRCKTNEVFRSPLSEIPLRIIEKYNDQPKKGNRLFSVPCINDYNRDLQIIRHFATIEKPVSSHIARHTMACLYLQGGGSIYTLSSILGHSNVRTTQIYGKLQDNGILNEARQVYQNLLNRDAAIIPISRLQNGYEDGSAKKTNTR